MKILLVNANPCLVPSASPYGLEIINGVLNEGGYNCTIYSPFMYGDFPYRHAKNYLSKICPKIIGIGIRNIDDCTAVPSTSAPGFIMSFFIGRIKRLVQSIKKACPYAILVLGGSGFNFYPEGLIREFNIDFGFIGTGEVGFLKFVGIVKKCKGNINSVPEDQLNEIPNLIFRKNGQIHRSHEKFELSAEKKSSPIIRSKGFLSVEKFTKNYIPVRTKSGCSMNCSYCVVPIGENISFRPVENVIGEIKQIVKLRNGITRVFFADAEFNLPSLNHPSEVLKKVCETNLNESINWVAYFTVKPFNKKFLDLIIESNCSGVSISADSLSDVVLSRNNKNFSQKEALKLMDHFVKIGLTTYVNIIIGLPGESLNSIEDTLNWVDSYASLGINFFISVGARIYPNTPLSKHASSEGRNFLYGYRQSPFLTPTLYCEPLSPLKITKLLLERVGNSPTVNIMHLNNEFSVHNNYLQVKTELTRGYHFMGTGEIAEARKWFKRAAKCDGPYCVDALWALSMLSDRVGDCYQKKRYILKLLEFKEKWPLQIDYKSVEKLYRI